MVWKSLDRFHQNTVKVLISTFLRRFFATRFHIFSIHARQRLINIPLAVNQFSYICLESCLDGIKRAQVLQHHSTSMLLPSAYHLSVHGYIYFAFFVTVFCSWCCRDTTKWEQTPNTRDKARDKVIQIICGCTRKMLSQYVDGVYIPLKQLLPFFIMKMSSRFHLSWGFISICQQRAGVATACCETTCAKWDAVSLMLMKTLLEQFIIKVPATVRAKKKSRTISITKNCEWENNRSRPNTSNRYLLFFDVNKSAPQWPLLQLHTVD